MTGAALKYLVTYTFTERHGARTGPDVEKVAVIITDGRAQDPRAVAIWHERVKVIFGSFGIESRDDPRWLWYIGLHPSGNICVAPFPDGIKQIV